MLAAKLAQSIQHSLWVCEVASLSPVSSDALVKIECARNSRGQLEVTASCLVETYTKLEELILAVGS